MGDGFQINDSTKTSLYSPFKPSKKPKKASKGDYYDIGAKLLEYSKTEKSHSAGIPKKVKEDIGKSLKKAEQKKAKELSLRNSMKAKNGLTWQQTQDKIKEYRKKYLPKRDIPVWYVDSPYRDYVYAQQKGGTVQFYVDERKFITDQMSPEERKDFEKTMEAYDELYAKNRVISQNGYDMTGVLYPNEVYISQKEPPEGSKKMYV